MVDKNRLMQELRCLKEQIKSDPAVLAKYDLDGNGEISGEEWELARKAVINALEEARRPAADAQPSGAAVAASAGFAAVGGAAEQVFSRLQEPTGVQSHVPAGTLLDQDKIQVQQQVETVELISSLEGRNRYKFLSASGQELAHAEESDTGFAGAVLRNLFSNSRAFSMGISVFGTDETIWVNRQFEFIFSRMKVTDPTGPVGEVNQKFSLLNRRYELVPYFGSRRLSLTGPILKPWTFYIQSGSRQLGIICKKWSGLMQEAFTRADTFEISFDSAGLQPAEKKLILAAAIAIDIDYFEKKQNK